MWGDKMKRGFIACCAASMLLLIAHLSFARDVDDFAYPTKVFCGDSDYYHMGGPEIRIGKIALFEEKLASIVRDLFSLNFDSWHIDADVQLDEFDTSLGDGKPGQDAGPRTDRLKFPTISNPAFLLDSGAGHNFNILDNDALHPEKEGDIDAVKTIRLPFKRTVKFSIMDNVALNLSVDRKRSRIDKNYRDLAPAAIKSETHVDGGAFIKFSF